MEQRLRSLGGGCAAGGVAHRGRASGITNSPLAPRHHATVSSTPRFNHHLKQFSCPVCELHDGSVDEEHTPSNKASSRGRCKDPLSPFSHVDSDVVQRHALYCSDDLTRKRLVHTTGAAHRGWW